MESSGVLRIFEAAAEAIAIVDRRIIDSSFRTDDRAFLELARLIIAAGGDVRAVFIFLADVQRRVSPAVLGLDDRRLRLWTGSCSTHFSRSPTTRMGSASRGGTGHGDSDTELHNTHLTRMASRFAHRVKAWGAGNGCP